MGLIFIRLLIAVGIAAALVLSLPIDTWAHDFWANHERVDPNTKALCCGEADHFELEESQVEQVADGWRIAGRFVTSVGTVLNIDQVIPTKSVQPSPDGHFHVNVWGGQIKCFFAPLSF